MLWQYADTETGLHHNHHRTYDPTLGRYLQPDPIGLAGGLNRYAYVGGNPVGKIDPLGLASTCGASFIDKPTGLQCGVIGGAIGGAIGGLIGGASSGICLAGAPACAAGSVPNGVAIGAGLGAAAGSAICKEDDNDDKNCKKASKYQLRKAGITNEHKFKKDLGIKKHASKYEICACKDGRITIARTGQCGKPTYHEETGIRWK